MFCCCGCRGYNIGVRLVDEFLAKSKQGRWVLRGAANNMYTIFFAVVIVISALAHQHGAAAVMVLVVQRIVECVNHVINLLRGAYTTAASGRQRQL